MFAIRYIYDGLGGFTRALVFHSTLSFREMYEFVELAPSVFNQAQRGSSPSEAREDDGKRLLDIAVERCYFLTSMAVFFFLSFCFIFIFFLSRTPVMDNTLNKGGPSNLLENSIIYFTYPSCWCK